MTRREFDCDVERHWQLGLAEAYRAKEAAATRPRKAAEWREAAEAAERRAEQYAAWAREARVASPSTISTQGA